MIRSYRPKYSGVAYVGAEPFPTDTAWCGGHDKSYRGLSPGYQYRSFCFWLGEEGDKEQ